MLGRYCANFEVDELLQDQEDDYDDSRQHNLLMLRDTVQYPVRAAIDHATAGNAAIPVNDAFYNAFSRTKSASEDKNLSLRCQRSRRHSR